MKWLSRDRLLKQRHVPVIGVFKQLLGGAMTWVTMLIFLFSGIAAWNTSTMQHVRDWLPWLNIGSFAAIVIAGLLVAMWLEHKFIQPSIMAYWNRMFYNHGSALRTDIEDVKSKLDELGKKVGEMAETLAQTAQGSDVNAGKTRRRAGRTRG